jgi:uncharacterized membrane protein
MHPTIPLDDRQIERINQAAAQSARKTSARIVSVVARGCGRYERAEDLVGLWAAAIALAIILCFFIDTPLDKVSADRGQTWRLGLLPVLVAITAGFFCGTVIVTQMFWVRRLFVPRRRLVRNVQERAKAIFQEYRLRDRQSPLVLVLVSIFERTSCILADETLHEALSGAQLDDLRRRLDRAIGHEQLDAAICRTIEKLSEMLSGVCPPPREQSIQKQDLLAVL